MTSIIHSMKVKVNEAKTRLSHLLNRAAAGEEGRYHQGR